MCLCKQYRTDSITYPVVWVGQLLRGAVKGFKVKGLLLVKGDDFGIRSSVILTEHLTLSDKSATGEEARSGW